MIFNDEMVLTAFEQIDRCPKCNVPFRGSAPGRLDVWYCAGRCLPDGHGGYVNVKTIGEASREHLHRRCGRCRYEWLEATHDQKIPVGENK